jgi:hypothetical protein
VLRFYGQLLAVLKNPALRSGQWRLLECDPAWEGNWTHDCFVAFGWHAAGTEPVVVAVNYAPNQSQCHVRLPFAELPGKRWRLSDRLCGAAYDWNGDDLAGRGLYLDMSPWQAAVFALVEQSA